MGGEARVRVARTVIITLAVAAFLTATRAFGARLSTPLLFVCWCGALGAAGFVAGPVTRLLSRGDWLVRRPVLRLAGLSVTSGLAIAPLIWLAGAAMAGRAPTATGLVTVLGPTLAISGCFVTLHALAARSGQADADPVPSETPQIAAPSTPRSALRQRLSPRRRDAVVWAVQAEDHYLRVHTDRGAELIFMRLSDALGEMEAQGARTHRSWWVARSAVAASRRDPGGRATLLLPDGTEVPVSRSH